MSNLSPPEDYNDVFLSVETVDAFATESFLHLSTPQNDQSIALNIFLMMLKDQRRKYAPWSKAAYALYQLYHSIANYPLLNGLPLDSAHPYMFSNSNRVDPDRIRVQREQQVRRVEHWCRMWIERATPDVVFEPRRTTFINGFVPTSEMTMRGFLTRIQRSITDNAGAVPDDVLTQELLTKLQRTDKLSIHYQAIYDVLLGVVWVGAVNQTIPAPERFWDELKLDSRFHFSYHSVVQPHIPKEAPIDAKKVLPAICTEAGKRASLVYKDYQVNTNPGFTW